VQGARARVIDCHVHVFREVSERYPRDVSPLFPAERSAPVEDLLATMQRHGVTGAVLVALSPHDEYVTECVHRYPETFRAILVDGPDPIRRLEAAGAHGLRMFELVADPELFAWLAAEDKKLWAYLEPADLRRLAAILESLPELTVVLNHLGFPFVEAPSIPPPTWPAVSDLALFPNVHVMFSGQYAFSRSAYPYPDLIEYARIVYETYGAARMMWASDYPWPAVEPGYGRLLELVDRSLPGLTEVERADILGRTCARLFGL
jgi:predicted TIM-barrel fold metal-dependent hydrolase